MAVPRKSASVLLSEQEYLQLERAAEERSEYFDGVVIAMAGESPKHGDVNTNLCVAVGSQLKNTPCRARVNNTKVRSGPAPGSRTGMRGMYSYPDIVVICGEPEYRDEVKDVVVNPKVIFEVLSPSTEKFDRGKKFLRYDAWNPTLTDYVLVSQDEPCIEHFYRRRDGGWSFDNYRGLKAKVPIASIRCTLKLRDVYDRVGFKK